MEITLKKIDNSNYETVCELDVTEKQEEYVACNMWSLVEAQYNHGYSCRAIYQDSTIVGFFMWVLETPSKISIWRFMIDKKYQNKGIGRTALSLAINEIKETTELEEIEICYKSTNPIAKEFYSSFGFQEVGLDEDGDDMLAVIKL
ncbi:GNAT family N-acetyltransferase [Veronia pacifica]|uniref:GCN5 family acetyltransferase n=1 Tax=Veronia pacifica TaxID=1080227 RepID=A0A1C3EMN2_9GAMM|nr:GNAT family N-acetyltransferase [Veronia pacifica]ODA34496.1 GCN5 family acetyltransferase [Veronia pacifica]